MGNADYCDEEMSIEDEAAVLDNMRLALRGLDHKPPDGSGALCAGMLECLSVGDPDRSRN